ncbi:MAG: IS630 family transposase [Polyangiaceae bacterium]|nr:IS630 family transposase [Polyangiaceae bacterium]
MLLLHAEGWSAPRIGRFLSYSDEWVRQVLRSFAVRGLASIHVHKPGPPPDLARFEQIRRALHSLLQRPRSWSSTQLSMALKEQGISLSARQVRKYLRRMNARYRRTRASLRHRQDRVARQRGRRQLGAYRALARKGRLRLVFFDECGFSPSQSTGRSWFLPEQIRDRPYESPQGKRATALAMYAPYGRRRHLRAEVLGKKVTTERILRTLRRIPHSRRKKTVVVLDNAPVHRSKLAQEGFHVLEEKGLKVLFLPPYSPDLNRVEVELGIVKYHHLPERTYFTQGHLERAVARAFQERALVLSRRAAN